MLSLHSQKCAFDSNMLYSPCWQLLAWFKNNTVGLSTSDACGDRTRTPSLVATHCRKNRYTTEKLIISLPAVVG